MNRMIALPIAVALAATACAKPDILRLDPTPRSATAPSTVHLIAQEPVRPYAVIAIVSTQSIQIERARRELIKLAAQLGGHAVLLDNSSLSRIGNDSNEQQLTGKVIVYTDSTGSN
ncbi:MAG TPA: hypothetical protein VMR92_05740 [Gemmatimonadales bacterium]|jgi:hypothetical protein|nr:hypothetical protein [Gemmatimonadales bacterium]